MLVDLSGTCAGVLLGESQMKRTKFQSLKTSIFIPNQSLIHWMSLVTLPN